MSPSLLNVERELKMIRVIRSAVIVTEDPNVIKQIGSLLIQYDYSLLVEKSKIKSIVKILEQEINLIVVDTEIQGNSHLDLINIIRKMRPRLPIIVLSNDNSVQTLRTFAQMGVFYSLLKPVESGEVENLVRALDKIDSQQKHLEQTGNRVKK